MDEDMPLTTDDGFVICADHEDRLAIWAAIRDLAETLLNEHPHCFITRAEFAEAVFGAGPSLKGWTWERVCDVCAGLWEERQARDGFPHAYQRIPRSWREQFARR